MEKITFGDDVPGYVHGPEDAAAAVVVIQEWWGITPEIKAQAEELSKRGGYRVLVPDLYRGKLGVDAEEAGHLLNNLDWPRAKEDLTQAVAYLKQSSKKVGVVGFCMGGALSLIAAQHAAADAAVAYYGTPQEGICQVEKIKIPVLLQFGKEDGTEGFSTPDVAQATFDKMKSAGGDVDLDIYPNVGHAFMNGFTEDAVQKMKDCQFPRPDNLQDVQKQSWQKMLDHFANHLAA